LHALHLDPETSLAYGDVVDPAPAESWYARMNEWRYDRSPVIAERVKRFANSGNIRCKLIELASEYDHLIAPKTNVDPYEKLVASAGKGEFYRRELVRNTQHVDSWSEDPDYAALVPARPAVLRAWDDLVEWVEG